MTRVRVYIACSLDGFIAGPDGDLSWLPTEVGESDPGAVQYEDFMADTGAMLMGRATYDAVCGFGVDWPYPVPVLVATSRPLDDGAPETARAVSGDIADLVADAKRTAGDKDVYLDGGALIRSALDAGLVEDLIVTQVPVVLGAGAPLFAGVKQRHALQLVSTARMGEMLQLTLRPAAHAPR
jgi:dihydrofolate reductase